MKNNKITQEELKQLTNTMKSCIWIELHVKDFWIIRDFYQNIWFEIIFDSPGNYLVIRKNKVILNFWWDKGRYNKQPYFRQFNNDSKKWFDVEIIIPVENIDKYYESIKNKVKIVEELKEKRWNTKDFRIEDPNWFYLRFTEPHDRVFEFKWYSSDED